MLVDGDIKVGLLGGSFDPAHEGHLYISKEAIKRLNLDQIWWLVSPQNPLKKKDQSKNLEKRLNEAAALASESAKIKVTDIEKEFGSNYSINTIAELKARFPKIRFVWLMGADNLIQIPKWHNWKEIFHSLPIAVFNREDFALESLKGKAASVFSNYQIDQSDFKILADFDPPAWGFINLKTNPASSTKLRKQK